MPLGLVSVDGSPNIKISMRDQKTGEVISRKIGEILTTYSTSYDAGWSTDSQSYVEGDLVQEAMVFFNQLDADGWNTREAATVIISYLSTLRSTASSVKISAVIDRPQ